MRVLSWFSAGRAFGTMRFTLGFVKRLALWTIVMAGLLAVNTSCSHKTRTTSSFRVLASSWALFIPESETGILNKISQIIGILLYAFIYILIQIDVLLTNLLISVVQYNGFSTSVAVTTGWPIIRDVCNMFFIIVLLIIAFSTIIGYDKFHYKKYLAQAATYGRPDQLLSKTLVGLLIDLSQVIMLTFVAGFKEAAFGNFARAFPDDGNLESRRQYPGHLEYRRRSLRPVHPGRSRPPPSSSCCLFP